MDITEEELKALEEQYKTAVHIADKPEEEKSIAEELEEFSIYNEETKKVEIIFTTLENIENNYIYLDSLNCNVLKENVIDINYIAHWLIEELEDYSLNEGYTLDDFIDCFHRKDLQVHRNIASYKYLKELDFYYIVEEHEEHNLIYNSLDNKIYISIPHLINNEFELDKDGKIIKYIPKTLDLTTINNYSIFKSSLDEFYKDNWDIIPIHVDNYKKDFNLVILYPEIKITNSKDEKHTIKDLYVIVPLHIEDNTFVFSGNLYGFRTFQTSDEYNNYTHSHLNASRILQIAKFCLGSGDINLTIKNLMIKNNFSEILFKGFLITLEYYLTWESLEGGPHYRMENLFNKSQEVKADLFNSFTLTDKTLFKKHFEKVNPIYLDGEIDYNLKELEECLTQCFIELSVNSCLVNYNPDTNKYYKITNNNNITKDLTEVSNITFRGSKLIGTVKVNTVESKNVKRVANPQYTNYVRKKFIERIGSSYFESKRDQEIRKTYSID